MSDLYWLTDEQMAKLSPFFPKSHGEAIATLIFSRPFTGARIETHW